MARPTLVKFGGELVQTADQIAALATAVRTWRAEGPVVLVHGGGKEIDGALRRAGIKEQRAEGLRITDAATLDVVVAVLAGTINTRIVAGLVTAGVPAVVSADTVAGATPVAASATVNITCTGLLASLPGAGLSSNTKGSENTGMSPASDSAPTTMVTDFGSLP